MRVLKRTAHELAHLVFEFASQARHVAHPGVVHEVEVRRLVGHEAVDRMHELIRVKLGRRRGRYDEGATRGIELAVGESKGIAGENARVCQIDDGLVMQRMPGRVNELELTAAEADALKV